MRCPCGEIISLDVAHCFVCGQRRPYAWHCACGQDVPWSHPTALAYRTDCPACGKEKPATPGLKLPEGSPARSYREQLSAHFQCLKCQHRGSRIRRVDENRDSDIVGVVLDLANSVFFSGLLAVSCTRCGFTELYNPDAIEG